MGKKMSDAPVYFTVAQVQFNPILNIEGYLTTIQDRMRIASFPDFKRVDIQQLVVPFGAAGEGGQPPVFDAEGRSFSMGAPCRDCRGPTAEGCPPKVGQWSFPGMPPRPLGPTAEGAGGKPVAPVPPPARPVPTPPMLPPGLKPPPAPTAQVVAPPAASAKPVAPPVPVTPMPPPGFRHPPTPPAHVAAPPFASAAPAAPAPAASATHP